MSGRALQPVPGVRGGAFGRWWSGSGVVFSVSSPHAAHIEFTSAIAALIEGEPHVLFLGEGGWQPSAPVDVKWLSWGMAPGRSEHARCVGRSQ